MSENIFETLAKRYDTPKQQALATTIRAKIQTKLPETAQKTLLDYGAGTGLISLPLAKKFKKVYLVDTAAEMLKISKIKIKQQNLTNVTLQQQDFASTTPTIQADVILLSLVLLHIPDTKKILTSLYQTLHTNGQLIIVDFDKNTAVHHPKIHSGFDHNALEKLLADIGFKEINIQTFYTGDKIFMNQKAALFIATSVK
ncbi:class I SAM-dependent methyltransferase [Agrilactobacillus yilanensis]|uniref:Class I SAM-dependent methyltransferase n=1 Tax=Agrilactobacillus yilanensis TaxID=2485997 RepID=A0ABW4J925_9LACO|nr:methyltransferase domain-containing protein [Agrilactobacillus yilanensis]